MSNSLTQKIEEYKARYQEMSVLQLCEALLRFLLCVVTWVYFLAMAIGLPFYFDTETGYNMMGTNKGDFFMNCGFTLAKVFLHVFVFFVVVALLRFFWEKRGEKGKIAFLINSFLDGLSLTDKLVIVYGVAVFLSYYYSRYPDMATLGAGGWYMGFKPQMLLIGSYFAISRLLASPKDRMVKVAMGCLLGTAFVVFALGLFNRYGVNPLGMEDVGPGFISTIGNINWYCGYWSVLFPLGAGLLLFLEEGESRKAYILKKGFLVLYTAVGFATGVTQGSDSCLLVFIALLILGGSLCVKDGERLKRFLEMFLLFCAVSATLWLIQKCFPERNQYITDLYNMVTSVSFWFTAAVAVFVLYLLANRKNISPIVYKIWYCVLGLSGLTLVSCVALLVMNTLYPGSIGALSDNPFFTFNSDWGSARGATWSAGVRTWLGQEALYKLIGVGPDCMAAHIYSGPDTELLNMVREAFGDSRLTNAHGEWITVLANLGLFGLVGFAGTMISAIVRFVRGGAKSAQAGIDKALLRDSATTASKALCMACGMALLCYTANNMFSFQQVMNISQMFLVLGLGEAVCRGRKG